jgi:uncharacterized protein (DUF2384 family)
MSKPKKKNEPVAKRAHKLPMDYITAVADRIHCTAPGEEIIRNTLVGVYTSAYAKGYSRAMADDKYRRTKRDARLADEWNRQRDLIDDIINPSPKSK